MSVNLPNLPPPAELAERRTLEARAKQKARALTYQNERDGLRALRVFGTYGPRCSAYLTGRSWFVWSLSTPSYSRRLTLGERLRLAVFGGAL